jgi:hypothetical protein
MAGEEDVPAPRCGALWHQMIGTNVVSAACMCLCVGVSHLQAPADGSAAVAIC